MQSVEPTTKDATSATRPVGPFMAVVSRQASRWPQAEHRTMHHRRPDRLSRITGSGTSWWQCALST
jgi:hypothetical protein